MNVEFIPVTLLFKQLRRLMSHALRQQHYTLVTMNFAPYILICAHTYTTLTDSFQEEPPEPA